VERLTLVELMFFNYSAIVRFGGASGLRDKAILGGALGLADSVFEYAEPATAVIGATVAVAAGIAKAHRFANGNKQTALLALVSTLDLNGQVHSGDLGRNGGLVGLGRWFVDGRAVPPLGSQAGPVPLKKERRRICTGPLGPSPRNRFMSMPTRFPRYHCAICSLFAYAVSRSLGAGGCFTIAHTL
jgi:prophage maintenance system killer protein